MSSTPFHVHILGAAETGKSQLSFAMTHQSFDEEYLQTIGARVSMLHSGRLELWDIGGNERYHGLYPLYIRNSELIVLVYPMDDPFALENLNKIIEIIKSQKPDTPIFLVGNKLDQQSTTPKPGELKTSLIEEHALNIVQTFETSAKNDINISTLRQAMISFAKQKSPVKKFPASYQALWDNEQGTLKQKILRLLEDYTKGNSALLRFFTGHWNRNHCMQVNNIIQAFKSDGPGLEIEDLLLQLDKLKLKNFNGSLATRFDFIQSKLEPNENVQTPKTHLPFNS